MVTKAKPKAETKAPKKRYRKRYVKDSSRPNYKASVTPKQILQLVVEALQENSEGEFILPGVLTKDLTGPNAGIIYFEYFIPILTKPRFQPPDSPDVINLFERYAADVVSELLSFPISDYDVSPNTCEECDAD